MYKLWYLCRSLSSRSTRGRIEDDFGDGEDGHLRSQNHFLNLFLRRNKMETLIVSGGEINIEQLKTYCEKYIRSEYYCMR